jgi:TetR/AcrR family transcriptional regulator, regulator of cefoperazone and chloramphenicol sensitivity
MSGHKPELGRQKVIEAAGEVFGEAGFRRATIREIARRAGVGLGVVHYHFSDKAGLYRAVCTHALATSLSGYVAAVEGVADPETKLRRWLDVFLKNIFGGTQPEWHARLVLRGMTEPGPEIDVFVSTLVRPHHDLISGILGELLGPGVGRDALLEHTLVLLGQCLVHHHLREIVAQLRGAPYGPEDVARLRDRILTLVLAGVRAERSPQAGRGSASARAQA